MIRMPNANPWRLLPSRAPYVLPEDRAAGYAPENRRVHRRPSFSRAVRRTLRGTDQPYPFYYLDPEPDGAGYRWWRGRLSALTSATSDEVVARGVLCVEYFPYHSVRFRHAAVRVPSQEFGFLLVRQALRRRAVVIVMRARRLWETAVPELRGYGRIFGLNSPQNVSIAPRNCPEGFDVAVRQLKVDASHRALKEVVRR